MRSARQWLAAGLVLTLVSSALAAPEGGKRSGPRGGALAKGTSGRSFKQAGDEGEGEEADGTPKKRAPKMGDAFMKGGNYRAAVAAYTKELKTSPDSVAAHIGLGRALARGGRCVEALDHLWPYTDTRPFGDEAALAAASCSDRLGLHEDAILFDQMAVERDPTNVRALTQYALDLDAAGAWGRRDAVLDELVVAKEDRDSSTYARAVIALRRGNLDEFDAILATWTGDPNTVNGEKLRLEAQSWLDLGDPASATATIRKLKMRQRGMHLYDLRAEAIRRMGDADLAWETLDSRMARAAAGSDIDAIRARILVDREEYDAAREMLAEYSESEDPDVLASYWYLSIRTGDQAAAGRYATAYKRVQVSPLRELSQLEPVTRYPTNPVRPAPLAPEFMGGKKGAEAPRRR